MELWDGFDYNTQFPPSFVVEISPIENQGWRPSRKSTSRIVCLEERFEALKDRKGRTLKREKWIEQ